MTADESLARFGLVPDEDVLPAIRAILAEEARREAAFEQRETDLAYLSCAQLFAKGHVEDALLIWRAKQSGFDLGCMIDIQSMCGAGLERTRQYLSSLSTPEAAAALRSLDECASAGDFDWFTVPGLLQTYRDYFSVE